MMPLKFFTIPIQDLASSEGELNGFLANHRVLSVDRHFVEHGASSFWTVCVDYLDGQPATSSDSRSRRAKVDYRDLLSPEDFAVYAKLRDLRKEIAQAEAVPVYTVFTNAQLAQMVQRRVNRRPRRHRGRRHGAKKAAQATRIKARRDGWIVVDRLGFLLNHSDTASWVAEDAEAEEDLQALAFPTPEAAHSAAEGGAGAAGEGHSLRAATKPNGVKSMIPIPEFPWR